VGSLYKKLKAREKKEEILQLMDCKKLFEYAISLGYVFIQYDSLKVNIQNIVDRDIIQYILVLILEKMVILL